MLGLASLVRPDNSTTPAVSNLYIPDTQTNIAINLPPNSDDVNFYINASDWYSWFAIGFGSTMTNSLMLVVYSAADNQHITVSPRLGTGDTEPPYYPGVNVTLGESSSIQTAPSSNSFFIVSGTCHNCRSWPGGSLDAKTTAQSFIYALGPNANLASNSPTAEIKRHIGYGHFTMDTIQATGDGGLPVLTSVPAQVDTGAAMAGDVVSDNDHGPIEHGILLVVATLVLSPLDLLVAGAMRRWPVLGVLTSTAMLIFLVAGVAVGIKISLEYIQTQHMATGHQVLGLITFALAIVVLALATAQCCMKRVAVGRGQDPRDWVQGRLGMVHAWAGRLVWLLLLINCGLGLQQAAAKTTVIIGYAVLAVGALIVMCLIQLCVYCFLRRKKAPKEEEDSAHQLAQLYAH